MAFVARATLGASVHYPETTKCMRHLVGKGYNCTFSNRQTKVLLPDVIPLLLFFGSGDQIIQKKDYMPKTKRHCGIKVDLWICIPWGCRHPHKF